MQCAEARKRLSDYMDGLLSAEDAALMCSHIAGCRECQGAWSELNKTVGHIRNLEEVEPPAWLTQKVMARVKEEARAEKGIWRKLFHPLHIKLPLEALAAVLIAATALYIFNVTGGELKITGSQPLQVGEQSAPKEDNAVTKSSGTAENKSTRESKNALKKEPARTLRSQVPKTEIASEPALKESGKSAPHQEALASPKGVLPGPPAQGPSVEVERSKAPAGAAAGYGGPVARDEQREEAPMTHAVSPSNEAMTQGRMEGHSMKKAEGAFPSDQITGKTISFALEVDDPVRAVKEVKRVLAKLGGRITATEALPDGTAVTTELDSQRISELFKKLKTVGKIRKKEPPAALHEGTATIKIELLKRP